MKTHANTERVIRGYDRAIRAIERAPVSVPFPQLKLPPPDKLIVTPRPKLRQTHFSYNTYDPTGFPDRPIFVMTSVNNEDIHRFYRLNGDSTLTLISTQQGVFDIDGGGFGWGWTVKRLGNSHYLMFNGVIWRSRDDCLTWERVFPPGNLADFLQIDSFVPAAMTIDVSGKIWLIATVESFVSGESSPLEADPGIYSSVDDGDTWVLERETDDFWCEGLEAHPTDPNIIAAAGWNNAFDLVVSISADAGASWNKHILPLEPAGALIECKICMWVNDTRFALVEADMDNVNNGGSGAFAIKFFYSDTPIAGGYNQVVLDETSETDYFNPVLGLSGNGTKLFAHAARTHLADIDNALVWISLDQGESFSPVTLWPDQLIFEDIASIFYDGVGDRLIIYTTGSLLDLGPSRLFISSPPGENWVEITP